MAKDQAKHEESFQVECKEIDRFKDCATFTVSLVRNPSNIVMG